MHYRHFYSVETNLYAHQMFFSDCAAVLIDYMQTLHIVFHHFLVYVKFITLSVSVKLLACSFGIWFWFGLPQYQYWLAIDLLYFPVAIEWIFKGVTCACFPVICNISWCFCRLEWQDRMGNTGTSKNFVSDQVCTKLIYTIDENSVFMRLTNKGKCK